MRWRCFCSRAGGCADHLDSRPSACAFRTSNRDRVRCLPSRCRWSRCRKTGNKGTREQGTRKRGRQLGGTILETRMESVLAELVSQADPAPATIRQGHLALLKRWYYRPEVKRSGEIFFPEADGHWPVKAILRGVGRIAAKSLTVV